MKTISPGTSRKSREDEFPLGGGEMGALVRALDWSKTSLGPISAWPAHLKATISLMLPAQAQGAVQGSEVALSHPVASLRGSLASLGDTLATPSPKQRRGFISAGQRSGLHDPATGERRKRRHSPARIAHSLR